MLDLMLKTAESLIGDIYVWGAEGQTIISESWIRSSETSEENAQRAIALWKKRIAEGREVIRAFDCSGFVSYLLITVGLLTGRGDCDRLWGMCTELTSPKNGALLFRVSSDDADDETHVGIYFNGYQYHSKGRDVGVVKEAYDADYWAKCGWFKGMVEDSDATVIEVEYVEKIYFSHALSKGCCCPDVSKLKSLLLKFGYSGVTVGNNSYGPITKALVTDFQQGKGLVADGVAGEETITALGGTYVK